MPHLLYTKRLYLRPCHTNDLESLHELWIEAEMRRFLFDNRQISSEETQSFIDASEANFTEHGYGLWLFFAEQQELMAGFAGLLQSLQGLPSLIFGTRPQFWGRGYATEAAQAILHYAFNVLKLEKVIADVDEPNGASIRVLETLGMSRTGRAIIHERPLLYYEIQTPLRDK